MAGKEENKDVNMEDANPPEKKLKTEDLLRMSIDSVFSLLDEKKVETKLTPAEERAALLSGKFLSSEDFLLFCSFLILNISLQLP